MIALNGLLLALLAILIPAFGALFSLFLSQLEDYIAAEGKTRDWALFILIFLPTTIVTILLLPILHRTNSSSTEWLPGIFFGIHLSELSIAFAVLIAGCSTLLALYSIAFMSDDRYRTRFWFFLQLALSGMMLGIFANNIYLMFFGFEIVSFSAFFLVSHFHQKQTIEGEKAGKAGIRYIIISLIGDLFLVIGLSMLVRAFGSTIFEELFEKWIDVPSNFIGGSSTSTRVLIGVFIILGALIKSGQFPLLFWPLNGNQKDIDLAKTPLPVGAYLISITLGNTGLYIISKFYPLFSNLAQEHLTGIDLFSNIPFLLLGWLVIATMIVATLFLISTENINRTLVSASIVQMGFAFLGLSSANQLGYIAAIFHIFASIPTTLALYVIFGMIYESLKRTQISRIGGIKDNFKELEIMGFIALLSFVGVFPTSVYFSKDMVFKSLLTSALPSSKIILVIAVICSVCLSFGLAKNLFKTLYGELEEEIGIKRPSVISYLSLGISLLWACLAGILFSFIGRPTPRFIRGLLFSEFDLGYDFPIFSDWILSPIILVIIPISITLTYLIYRDGHGHLLTKLRDSKFIIWSRKIIESMFYIETFYTFIFTKPAKYFSKFLAQTRLKSSAAVVILAVFAIIILFAIIFLVGGT